VLLVNLLSALATVVTALGVYIVGSDGFLPVPLLLGLTAGMFIYIAASDIIPDIHEKPHEQALRQSAMLLLGVAVVGGAISALHYVMH
jgi:zinc and cadmium transporter